MNQTTNEIEQQQLKIADFFFNYHFDKELARLQYQVLQTHKDWEMSRQTEMSCTELSKGRLLLRTFDAEWLVEPIQSKEVHMLYLEFKTDSSNVEAAYSLVYDFPPPNGDRKARRVNEYTRKGIDHVLSLMVNN